MVNFACLAKAAIPALCRLSLSLSGHLPRLRSEDRQELVAIPSTFLLLLRCKPSVSQNQDELQKNTDLWEANCPNGPVEKAGAIFISPPQSILRIARMRAGQTAFGH